MSETTPEPSMPSRDRANSASGSPSTGGFGLPPATGPRTDHCIFALGLMGINVVLIVIFALYPKMLTALGDSLAYVSTAGNIIHHGKFYIPFPRPNFPIGLSVVLAPANAFQSNFWRFFLMYATQLLFVNACVIAAYRSFRRLGSDRRLVWAALAVALTAGLVSELIVRVFSETVFTAAIILAFLFLCRAVETEKRRYWFLASLATCFSYTVRIIGIGLVLSLAVVIVVHLAFRGRRGVRVLIPALLGGILGTGTLLAQRLSVWIYEPSVFRAHYTRMMPNYLEWMGSALTTAEGFQIFLKATWWQSSMLILVSLGGAIVLLVFSRRLVTRSWAKLREDGNFVEPYVFVMIFFLFTLAHAIVHGFGYILGEYSSDIQMRYLLPLGSLLLVASVYFVEKYPESARVLHARRVTVMAFILAFFAVLVTVIPLTRMRGYRLRSLEYVVDLIGFPMYPVSFLAIVFSAVFFFSWCRRKPAYLLLLVMSAALFFGSFLGFTVPRIRDAQGMERRELQPVADLLGHQVFQRGDIEDIWLLHPGWARRRFFQLQAKVFYKKDYHYHAATYEEFSKLPDEARKNTIVFIQRDDEIDCRRLATGSVQALYVCE